jgi:lipoprotein-releasing system permease protein
LLSVILKNYDITRLTGGIFYFMKTVPVKLELADLISIVSSALIICFLATLAPARLAAKNNPVESLRHT